MIEFRCIFCISSKHVKFDERCNNGIIIDTIFFLYLRRAGFSNFLPYRFSAIHHSHHSQLGAQLTLLLPNKGFLVRLVIVKMNLHAH